MTPRAETKYEQQAVCGQAHAVFDILTRTESLPCDLSLSIEEILERAWELAYHRPTGLTATNVISLADFKRTADLTART